MHLQPVARQLGGEVAGHQVLAPEPGQIPPGTAPWRFGYRPAPLMA